MCRPVQGWGDMEWTHPGFATFRSLTPWATLCRPFGARNGAGQRPALAVAWPRHWSLALLAVRTVTGAGSIRFQRAMVYQSGSCASALQKVGAPSGKALKERGTRSRRATTFWSARSGQLPLWNAEVLLRPRPSQGREACAVSSPEGATQCSPGCQRPEGRKPWVSPSHIRPALHRATHIPG